MTGVALLLAGVVTGALLGGGAGFVAAGQQEPEVREVEVIKTELVEVAPQACKDALGAAEEVRLDHERHATALATLYQLVADAFAAGNDRDLVAGQDVLDRMNAVSEDSQERTAEIAEVVREYESAAEDCR